MDIGIGRQENLQIAPTSGDGGSVSGNYLRGIREYLIQRHLDVPTFLADFGLSSDTLEDAGQRISLEVYQRMLERAGDLTGDVDVGLHTGECIKPGQYGVLGLSVMSCKNAQEAFERHMRYESLVSNRSVSTYHYEGSDIRLTWDTGGFTIGREMADENVASWVTFLRWITGQCETMTAVHFVHAQPEDLSEYERIFSCPILFSQPMVELIFPASYKNIPIIQHDPVMREMMDAYAEQLLEEFSQSDSLLGSVRALIAEALPKGGVALDCIAQELDINPRTLQRRLSEQGQSFKGLLDEVRKGLALTYIAQPFIDLAELAYLLGFSDQSAFQRAFKKWTGTSPRKYKQAAP